MRYCLLKRVLPFALALIVGILLASTLDSGLVGLLGNSENEDSIPAERPLLRDAIISRVPVPRYAKLWSGTVDVDVELGSDGRVWDVRTRTSVEYSDLTDRDFHDAAERIEFSPATLNGCEVPVWVRITYDFSERGAVKARVGEQIWSNEPSVNLFLGN